LKLLSARFRSCSEVMEAISCAAFTAKNTSPLVALIHSICRLEIKNIYVLIAGNKAPT
jgi:hypothetical protein